jgi:hypothetical protein
MGLKKKEKKEKAKKKKDSVFSEHKQLMNFKKKEN